MQYNISPETLVETRHPSVTVDKILNQELTFEMYKDNAVCANGAMFRKDVSWIFTRVDGQDVWGSCGLQKRK